MCLLNYFLLTVTLAGVAFQDDLFSYCNRVRRTILEVSLHAEKCAAIMYGQDSVLYKYLNYYYVLEPIYIPQALYVRICISQL